MKKSFHRHDSVDDNLSADYYSRLCLVPITKNSHQPNKLRGSRRMHEVHCTRSGHIVSATVKADTVVVTVECESKTGSHSWLMLLYSGTSLSCFLLADRWHAANSYRYLYCSCISRTQTCEATVSASCTS